MRETELSTTLSRGRWPTWWSDSLTLVMLGEVGDAVLAAVREAVAEGELTVPVPERVPVRATATGEYSSPLPLRLAKAAGRPAPEIADLLASRLARRQGVRRVRVTGPGFLTIDAPLTRAAVETYGVISDAPWPVRPFTFDNPGFRVRFAYARACAIRRHAAGLGISSGSGPLGALERRLLGLLADFPAHARRAAEAGDPRPVSRRLEAIADTYHDVHERCPALPKGDEQISDRHAARLGLAEAVRVTVGGGLRMLGEVPSERL
jgi:arginyl-tRNA synthetase